MKDSYYNIDFAIRRVKRNNRNYLLDIEEMIEDKKFNCMMFGGCEKCNKVYDFLECGIGRIRRYIKCLR